MTGGEGFKSVRQPPRGSPYPFDAKRESFGVDEDPRQARVVAPVGELDLLTVDELEGALQQALDRGCRHLVLDLRGLSFMDSQGLHLVMRWNSYAEQSGFAFGVIQGGPAVRRLFEIVGLLDQLPFLDPIGDGPAASERAPLATEAVPLGLAQPAIRYGMAFALEALSAKRSLDDAVRPSPFERNGDRVSQQHVLCPPRGRYAVIRVNDLTQAFRGLGEKIVGFNLEIAGTLAANQRLKDAGHSLQEAGTERLRAAEEEAKAVGRQAEARDHESRQRAFQTNSGSSEKAPGSES